ncbi:MAG: tRNA (adenosine(37)-N6)-dimethylallyltransferase MiaA [Candidatus Hydrogenedens sp.]|nr:tRNA (adenosine(37)-N6)-dimethylallyltransferase MiaA [Candidatus Hydrogenedens sp.]
MQPPSNPSPAVIGVVGPTGSGKTALAIAMARRLDTEIISADSMQFYRGMEIGTAAPTGGEQAAAKHHFVSFIDPDQAMSASDFERLARQEIARINAEGKPAIVCGGSGLYVSAVVEGLFPGPARSESVRAKLKQEAEEQGNEAMMARLRAVDPEYAALLSSGNDLVRIVRALEVYELTGQPFSRLHAEHRAAAEPLDAVLLGLDWPREALYERINRRLDAMIGSGWVEEVQALIDLGYGEHIERLKALGFREIAAYLRGEQSLDDAIEAAKMHHRRYAKRQLSWFRNVLNVHWLAVDAETSTDALAERALDRLYAERPGAWPGRSSD